MNDLQWLDALPDKNTEIVKRDLTLPQLPQQRPEMLGRLEANNDGLPQLPQHAPTQKSMYRAEKAPAAHGEGAVREINSAVENYPQEALEAGFLACWQLLWHGGLLTLPVQRSGRECHGCQHLDMTNERRPGTRRVFFWACALGHQQLEMGYTGERIIIAPTGCEQYTSTR